MIRENSFMYLTSAFSKKDPQVQRIWPPSTILLAGLSLSARLLLGWQLHGNAELPRKCYLCFLENSFHQFVCDHLKNGRARFEKLFKTTLCWNFQTTCVFNQQSFVLWPQILCLLSIRCCRRIIDLQTLLVTRLSKYVSKRLESCTCRRRKQSLTRIMYQADRILPEKEKVKKFLCSNWLLELVAFNWKRSQRRVASERRDWAKQHDKLEGVCHHQVFFPLVRGDKLFNLQSGRRKKRYKNQQKSSSAQTEEKGFNG